MNISMNRDQVTMTIHLDIAAQKIINMMVINNENIENQLKAGIEKAFKEFDFETVVTAAKLGEAASDCSGEGQ